MFVLLFLVFIMIDISNEQKNEIVSKIGFYCERPIAELRCSRNQVSIVDYNILGDAKCAGWNTISIDDEVTKLNGESVSKWLPLKIYEYVTSTDISSVSFTNAQLRRMEKNQKEVKRQMRLEMTPEEQTAKKQKRKEDDAQRLQRMTPEGETAKKQKRKEDDAQRLQRMTPEGETAKKQKRKEVDAQRLQRMTPEGETAKKQKRKEDNAQYQRKEQTAKKQKRKEDDAQRLQRMTPEEQTAKKQKRKEDNAQQYQRKKSTEVHEIHNNESDESQSNENLDAAMYKEAIDSSMVFFTCGCCEVEHGQSMMTKIEESELRRIAMSGIGEAYDSMVKILSEPFHLSNQYKIAFATAARNELFDGRDDRRRGLLTGSDYLCKDCLKNLPRDSNPEDDKIVSLRSLFDEEAVEENVLSPSNEFHGLLPPRALVNGYFRGRTPKCLEDLNRVELSMVNLINVMSRITMLPSGGHYASNTTVFSVLNDLVQVATSLPTEPTIDLVAVIRSSSTNLPGEFMYSPYKVHKALLWLSANNFLYKDKVHLEPVVDKNVEQEVPSIIASDEDMNIYTSSSHSLKKQ